MAWNCLLTIPSGNAGEETTLNFWLPHGLQLIAQETQDDTEWKNADVLSCCVVQETAETWVLWAVPGMLKSYVPLWLGDRERYACVPYKNLGCRKSMWGQGKMSHVQWTNSCAQTARPFVVLHWGILIRWWRKPLTTSISSTTSNAATTTTNVAPDSPLLVTDSFRESQQPLLEVDTLIALQLQVPTSNPPTASQTTTSDRKTLEVQFYGEVCKKPCIT